MKSNSSYLLLFFSFVISINSCRKEEEAVAERVGESLLTSLRHETSTISFEIHYNGEKAISSIPWDFGDGSISTSTSKTTTHTYATRGTYEVGREYR
jgi:hypothetical protein